VHGRGFPPYLRQNIVVIGLIRLYLTSFWYIPLAGFEDAPIPI
jgi:hypothetical protein